MKLPSIALTLLASISSLAHASQDILNFTNNDTLHGEFIGFEGTKGLKWKSNQAQEAITFETAEIRKIVFNQGLSRKPFSHSSIIILSNGDTLPCSINEISEETLLVHSDLTGDLSIPKEHVRSCIINPLGQQTLYQGPYLAENWDVSHMPNHLQDQQNEELAPSWEFGSFGWYNKGVMGAISLRDFQLPDEFRLRYLTESPRHSNTAIVINADLQHFRKAPDNEESPAQYNSAERVTAIFGSCLTIKLGSHNATLTAYTVSENGETSHTNIKPINGRGNIRRDSNSNTTEIELRVSHPKQVISVYYQGQLVNQWSLKDIEDIPTGRAFGFLAHYGGNNYLTRISEIAIAPWNGILDSAQSLESAAQDIVLLSNGMERFAGKVAKLTGNELQFDNSYATLTIPCNDLQSIHFATNQLGTQPKKNSESIQFQFSQAGILTATPSSSEGQDVLIDHPILGQIKLNANYLTAINYRAGTSMLDQWNTQIEQ